MGVANRLGMSGWCTVVLLCFFLISCRAAVVTCPDNLTAKLDDKQLLISCDIINIQDSGQLQVRWSMTDNNGIENQISSAQTKYDQSTANIGTGRRTVLSVNEVRETDGGKYKIIVQDGSGSSEASINVDIKGPPVITNQHDTVFGEAGTDLVLQCDIRSWPVPIQYRWFHNSRQLQNDINRYSIYDKTTSSDITAISYLKILKFNTSNEGTYICDVYNGIDSSTFTITAKVGNNKSLTCKEEHNCNNLQTCDKTYGCSCIKGYTKLSDGGCRDINECALNTDDCQSPKVCSNTQGSFTCVCGDGYVLVEGTSNCEVYVPPTKPPVNDLTVFAIVGVVMAIVVIGGIVIAVFILRRRNKHKHFKKSSSQHTYDTANSPSSSIVPQVAYNQVEIQNEIGKGRFGKVYIAKAWSLSSPGSVETVAVKQSRQDLGEEDRTIFLHELNLVKNLPYNRHVVRCVGYFYQPMISMLFEFMPYGDLLTYLRQKKPQGFRLSQSSLSSAPLTATHIFDFALQCAKGMQHLHENKIIHRDLAARNILVANENCCKISDFGMARKVGEDYIYTSRSKRPLPLLWMAPEAIFEEITSNKSDVWSFGVLFWEMITLGSRPYPGRTGQQVLDLIQTGERMERPPHCAMEVYNMLLNCWHHNPDSRPEFHELADDLEMRLDLAENYLQLSKYSQQSFYFVDHVSMSDLDLDRSDRGSSTLKRSKSRRSHRSHHQIHL